jgi:hypothetical protein
MRSVMYLLFVIGLSCTTSAVAQDFKIDHFKFYKLFAEKRIDTTIAIKGQFDEEAMRSRIVGPWLFANPVINDRGKIRDKNAHFTAYFILDGREPKRTVTFSNQFGDQKAVIGRAELFLAPTAKNHKDERFPVSKQLDHFKCYRVEDAEMLNRKVKLTDQFKEEEKNIALRAVYFCVPVEKTHKDRVTKIKNARDHLVLYELKAHTSTPTFDIGTADQFDDPRGEVYTVMWLGVPTEKHRVR